MALTLLEACGGHGNLYFKFSAEPHATAEMVFTLSIIEKYHVFGRRLPYLKPVPNVPSFRLPRHIFLDAFSLHDVIERLLSYVPCFGDPDTLNFMRNQLSGFCVQTQHHYNMPGVRFHIIADLHFRARQVYGGLVVITSSDEINDDHVDNGRTAQSSGEVTASDMAIAKLETLKVTTAARSTEFGQQCCSICLEDFDDAVDDLDLARPPCSHVFHYHCIVQWLEQSQVCPLCRHEVK